MRGTAYESKSCQCRIIRQALPYLRRLPYLIQFCRTKLIQTPYYCRTITVSFGTAHERYGVWTGPYAPCFLLSLSTSFHELYDSLYGLFFHPYMSAIYRSYHMINLLSAWSLFFARIEVILYSITSFYSGLRQEILFCFCLWFQFIPSLFSCHGTRSCLINEFLR